MGCTGITAGGEAKAAAGGDVGAFATGSIVVGVRLIGAIGIWFGSTAVAVVAFQDASAYFFQAAETTEAGTSDVFHAAC